MQIIVHVIGRDDMSQTGVGAALLLCLLLSFVVFGYIATKKHTFAVLKKRVMQILSGLSALALALTLMISAGVNLASAMTTQSVRTSSIELTVFQGGSSVGDTKAEVDISSDSNSGWEYFAKATQDLPNGLSLQLGGTEISAQNAMLSEGDKPTNAIIDYDVSATAAKEIAPNDYVIDLDLQTIDKSAGGDGDVSTGDDDNSFSEHFTNWYGGDLVVKDGGAIASFDTQNPQNNAIKVGDTLCTTTGSGFVAGNPNKIGCVLPKLPAGDYSIFASTDNQIHYTKVGTVTYSQRPFEMGADNGETAADSMKQGEVRVLTDLRDGNQYRVKKMPDDNIWMIDNLAYNPISDFDENKIDIIRGGSYAISTAEKPQVITTGATLTEDMGFLYNWCAAIADTSLKCAESRALASAQSGETVTTSIVPEGWVLPQGNSGGYFDKLAFAMQIVAKTNPAYVSGGNVLEASNMNWVPDSPWQGAFSGYFRSNDRFRDDYMGLNVQGFNGEGHYWSSTTFTSGKTNSLEFSNSNVTPHYYTPISYGLAIRAVLPNNRDLSVDAKKYSYQATNWGGGDLIIKDGGAISTFNTASPNENKIRIGIKNCDTSGQNFIAEKTNKIGCVLPNLEEGKYDVSVSTNNGGRYTKVGEVIYKKTAFDNANAQRERKAMRQGEVRVLTDERDGKVYRVKKMPDGNVWMIDNLAFDISGKDAPNWQTPVETLKCEIYPQTNCVQPSSSAPQFVKLNEIQGYQPEVAHVNYGYLYNWCATTADTSENCNTSREKQLFDQMDYSISPQGWELPKVGESASFRALANAMAEQSSINPLYTLDSKGSLNWSITGPWSGIYSGRYTDYGIPTGLSAQGAGGYYWTASASSSQQLSRSFSFYNEGITNLDSLGVRSDAFAVRAVLTDPKVLQSSLLSINSSAQVPTTQNANSFSVKVDGGNGSGAYLLKSVGQDVCKVNNKSVAPNTSINVPLVGAGECKLELRKVGDDKYYGQSLVKDFTVYSVEYSGLDAKTTNPFSIPPQYVLAGGSILTAEEPLISDGRSFTYWCIDKDNCTRESSVDANVAFKPSNNTELVAKWDIGEISTNNFSFGEHLTNFAGGDLVVREGTDIEQFSAIPDANKIKIGNNDCITTGQGYLDASKNTDGKARIGCVLPSLTEGLYDVNVSVDSGKNYVKIGEISYRAVAFNNADRQRSRLMMKQGEVRILTDTRCLGNGGTQKCGNSAGLGAGKYRVKKMPDGNVWMIDNLAYTPRANVDYNGATGITDLTDTKNPVSSSQAQYYRISESAVGKDHPEWGYLYNWCAATADTSEDCSVSANENHADNMETSISPSGWTLPLGMSDDQYMTLAQSMEEQSKTNPVYALGDPYLEFRGEQNWTLGSPWQGVLAGGYDKIGFKYTNSEMYYWSASSDYLDDKGYALGMAVWRKPSSLFISRSSNSKSSNLAVRGMLSDDKETQNDVSVFLVDNVKPSEGVENAFRISVSRGSSIGIFVATVSPTNVCYIADSDSHFHYWNKILIHLAGSGICNVTVKHAGDHKYHSKTDSVDFSVFSVEYDGILSGETFPAQYVLSADQVPWIYREVITPTPQSSAERPFLGWCTSVVIDDKCTGKIIGANTSFEPESAILLTALYDALEK